MSEKKWWVPPWIAFPALECGSMGWRMGAGEAFLEERMGWWSSLTPDERQQYQELFPEPMPWKQYSDPCGVILRKGHLALPLWQPQGKAKYDRQWAADAYRQGKLPAILPFWGHTPSKDGRLTKSCFSQWWPSDFWFWGDSYCNMEQCMMAGKARCFQDFDTLKEILAAEDPQKIKRLGRKVASFDEKVWNEVKYSLILNGNYAKFTQNEELRQFLLSTGDSVLVEASPYDIIWGIGLEAEHPDAQNPEKWRGQNLLGFALMEVRDEIRRVYANVDLCQEWR